MILTLSQHSSTPGQEEQEEKSAGHSNRTCMPRPCILHDAPPCRWEMVLTTASHGSRARLGPPRAQFLVSCSAPGPTSAQGCHAPHFPSRQALFASSICTRPLRGLLTPVTCQTDASRRATKEQRCSTAFQQGSMHEQGGRCGQGRTCHLQCTCIACTASPRGVT